MRNLGKAQQGGCVYGRQQVVYLQTQALGELRQIFPAAAIVDDFEQSADSADARVRQHRETGRWLRRREFRDRRLRIGHDGVDVIHQSDEPRPFLVPRPRNLHLHLAADAARIRPQHHDSVRQQHGLLDVVRHHQNAFRGKCPALPEVADFTAQVLGGEDVEGAERLVHHQYIRLHHEGPRETHSLAHAAGKFFRIGAFEAFQAHHAERERGFFFADFLDTPRAKSPSSAFSWTVSHGSSAKL